MKVRIGSHFLFDFAWAGFLAGTVLAPFVFFILRYYRSVYLDKKEATACKRCALLICLCYYIATAALVLYMVDAISSVVIGLLIVNGGILAFMSHWYVYFLEKPAWPTMGPGRIEGLKLKHAKYLEFARLVSWCTVGVVTGVWVLTWAYWWREIPESLRYGYDFQMTMAISSLGNLTVVAGLWFGLIAPFISQLGRIEDALLSSVDAARSEDLR